MLHPAIKPWIDIDSNRSLIDAQLFNQPKLKANIEVRYHGFQLTDTLITDTDPQTDYALKGHDVIGIKKMTLPTLS